MSLVKSLGLATRMLKHNPALFTAVRNHWNKDFKPAPFPINQDARIAAANKYGILPVEYETYPDNGDGLGDYPKVPAESGDSRDPWYPYDNPELKRNFNEPVHVDFEAIGEDRVDVNKKMYISHTMQWVQFISALLIASALMYTGEYFKMFHSIAPKQYPQPDKKHYTFETCD